MARLPVFIFIIVFALSIALTQFLAWQQYKISKETRRAELVHEATNAKDRFRNILFNDIAAANTLAIIYKQYGVPAKFDSVAHQIIQNSRYAEALQITENGIVKNVYPDIPYKATIGTNVNTDPVRKAEEDRAIEFKGIYFAGPRRLRFGDTGILGKVPIITGNKVIAVTTVLTRLSTIKKALAPPGSGKNRFAYQLKDTHIKGSPFFLLSDAKPVVKSEYADMYIPEGDWLLRVSYSNEYAAGSFPIELSGLGLLFSFIAALLAYRKAQEPFKLSKIIDEKTEQLAKSERYFRTLIETSSDAIVLLDPDGKVLYQSPSTDKILGYTLAEIQQMDSLQLIHPDDREADNNIFYKEISVPGAIVHRSHRVKHKNGNYIYAEGTYRNLLHDENIKAIVYSYKDVTEKVESQTKFENLVENFIVGVYILQNNKVVYVNPRVLEETGYKEEEIINMPFDCFIYPDDVKLVRDIIDRRINQGIKTVRYEVRIQRKDGKPMWYEILGSSTMYRGAPALIGTMVDITKRKAADREIHRLTRLYQFMSSINESMLKSEDTEQVYAEACRIAVEVGKFQMAWIGTYDEKNDRIIPVTWSGHEDGFLNKINAAGMKVSVSAIPSARAIREQKHFYYNDIANDPDIPPDIKQEMIKRGYLSGVSFPILIAGEIVAAMVLLMSEPFFFNEEEIELLRDVTDNITYALDKIRIQGLQNQSEANLHSIFDTTNVSYLLLDTDYKIIALNQQMKDVYMAAAGLELKEGDNLIETMHPEKKAGAKAIYDKVIQANQSENYETTYEKNGIYTHFLANVKPIHDGTKVIGICISAIDITERKKMTLDLLNHVNAIEEQNKKLREIAWIQSHVVRAPLARIMGLIDLFNNNENNDIDKDMILNYMTISANELDEIVKNITDKVYVD